MGKGRGKFFMFVLVIGCIILLSITVIILILTIQSATLDQRIAQFETKRKIPDSENAAVIYESIFTDANFATTFEGDFFSEMRISIDFIKPWKSEDYPEAAEWIKDRQHIIDRLLTASKFENCFLPLPVKNNKFYTSDRLVCFRKIVDYLRIASLNDIAEGRFDKVMEKNYIFLRMGEHISHQPWTDAYLIGTAIQASPLGNLKKYIIDPNITEEQLKVIEIFIVLIEQELNKPLKPHLIEGDKLIAEKIREKKPLFRRIKWLYIEYLNNKTDRKFASDFYCRFLSYGRGDRILIGLRKFKNQNGNWPDSLEQIKPFVDPIVLVDPRNNGSFIYKLTDNGFTLYSCGPNNIDEGGKYDSFNQGADDLLIWPEKR